MTSLQKQIQEAALNEKEAVMYIAALELGSGTMSDLSRRSGIKRGAAYYTVEELARKNLLVKVPQGKRMFYRSADPKILGSVLDKKKKQIENILPNLEEIFQKSTQRPSARVYEHREGLRAIYQEMATSGQMVYNIFSAEKYFRAFSEKDGEDFLTAILNNGGTIKELVENTRAGKRYVKGKYTKKFGTARILPENFKVSTDLIISGNAVAMISLTNLMGVIIENLEIAELQREMFMHVWDNANQI